LTKNCKKERNIKKKENRFSEENLNREVNIKKLTFKMGNILDPTGNY
jgi:hypothetical protein